MRYIITLLILIGCVKKDPIPVIKVEEYINPDQVVSKSNSPIDHQSSGYYGKKLEDINKNQDEKIESSKGLVTNQAIIIELRNRGLDVREVKRGVVVTLPDVLFEFDKTDVTDKAKVHLDEIYLTVHNLKRSLSVEGHTDNMGDVIYNKQLSEDRAKRVKDELIARGISKSRLKYFGYGESMPISSNRSDDGRARNRRVEVVIEN